MKQTEKEMTKAVEDMMARGNGDIPQEQKIIDPEKENDEVVSTGELKPEEAVLQEPEIVPNASQEDQVTIEKADKRIKSAQSLMQITKTENKQLKNELDHAMTTLEEYKDMVKDRLSGKEEIPQSDEVETNVPVIAQNDFSAIEENYPEIVKPLVDAVKSMQSQVKDLEKNQIVSQRQTEDNFHFDKISRAYPDYKEIYKSDDFKQWYNESSGFVQTASTNAIKGGNSDDVISMYDKFFVDTTGMARGGDSSVKKQQPGLKQAKEMLALAAKEDRPSVKQVSNVNVQPKTDSVTMSEIKGMEGTDANIDRILNAMSTDNIK